jgi:Plasmid pRiA4b ORF-3-like protein/Domain of unknown function (DUF1841)
MLRAFKPLVQEGDPLTVEIFASGLVGTWWDQLPFDEDPEATEPPLELDLVRRIERKGGPPALALLRALASVADTERLRDAASTAAGALAAAGVTEPTWVAQLGQVEVGDCWRFADIFGDQASLLVEFGYGARPHGLVVLLDFNHLGGWVKDLFVTPDPAQVLRDMRKASMSDPFATLEQVEPSESRRLIERCLAATDETWLPEVGEEFPHYRALALARCRAMPEPAQADELAVKIEIVGAVRDAIVDEFLASTHAASLLGDVTGDMADAVRFCARLLVDFGADYDAGKPLRVSPAKVEHFLLDWVPGKVVLDDADRDALPAVVSAWVRWAGERTGLPSSAVDLVAKVAADSGVQFGEVYEDAADTSPARLLLQDLPIDGGEEALREAMDRRVFTMPFYGTEIAGEDFPRLDPGDPDERRLLIEGEHPEYHDALTDPDFHGEIDGGNPRLHITMHEVVANQLWDDDPPEAWQAAKRLRDAGMERHDILHQLGGPVISQIHRVLANQEPADNEQLARDLAALQPPTAKRRAKRATKQGATPAKGAGDKVYQVKVTLADIWPPIWRQLRLPASASLGQVHEVIQVAFGWDDSHLHKFEARGRHYSRPEWGLEDFRTGGPVPDEDMVTLREAAPRKGSRMRYEYDFGDSWVHEIVVEEALPHDGVPHAVCLAGERAAPPEDCGGAPRYEVLLEVLVDPDHPEREDWLEWLGDGYDPEAFDKDAINRDLARLPLS